MLLDGCVGGARGGDLVLSGFPAPQLNRRYWSYVAGPLLCLQSPPATTLGAVLMAFEMRSLEGPYQYCVQQIENSSCLQVCSVGYAKINWQRLLYTRTFGSSLVPTRFPQHLHASNLGLDDLHDLRRPTEPCNAVPAPRPSSVAVAAVQLGAVAVVSKVLGVYQDTGMDFNGAVLYRHATMSWPPLFLRYYPRSQEWCVEMGWCYVHGCFQANPEAAGCGSPWMGCRQGIEVMCLKDTTWAIRDWISSREPELQHAQRRIEENCCPDALLTLPGAHQEKAGLLRLPLVMGNYTGLKSESIWARERSDLRARTRAKQPRLRRRHVIVVRVPKASSSTLASVFVRLGRSLGHLIPVGAHESSRASLGDRGGCQ
ncbi:unnamed protein product [Durusdinium trenchii]|uniref:Uncharacterized protein n=1 Tax=Durusdinium trenchii TaxID=1381693 RepID=A0ABP0HT10_9DINO